MLDHQTNNSLMSTGRSVYKRNDCRLLVQAHAKETFDDVSMSIMSSTNQRATIVTIGTRDSTSGQKNLHHIFMPSFSGILQRVLIFTSVWICPISEQKAYNVFVTIECRR